MPKPTTNFPPLITKEEYNSRLEADPINPPHYHGDRVMKIIEEFDLDFLDGQVIKYILRAGKKEGNTDLTDHKKALWYLERKIKNMEGK